MNRRFALHALVEGAFTLLWATASTAGTTGPYAAVDAEARAELEAIAPAALPSWDAANAARDAGRFADAEAGYRAVAGAAPRFDHAHRRLCSSLSALRRTDEAVIECRTALSLRESPENEAALAASLVDAASPSPAALTEAHGLILHAQKTKPEDVAITSIAARVAMARGDGASLDEDVATLQRIAPDAEDTVYLEILQDLDREDVDGARAELARHKGLFPPERAAGIQTMIDDVAAHPSPAHLAWRIAKVLALCVGVLLTAALALRLRKPKRAA